MTNKEKTFKRIKQKLSSNVKKAYWKAACDLCNYVESTKDVEKMWPMVVKYSSSRNPDLRLAMACCILEHILQFHFDTYFEKCTKLIMNGNLLFGDTFSYCSKFGQAKQSDNAKKFNDLIGKFYMLKRQKNFNRRMKASFLSLQLNEVSK